MTRIPKVCESRILIQFNSILLHMGALYFQFPFIHVLYWYLFCM